MAFGSVANSFPTIKMEISANDYFSQGVKVLLQGITKIVLNCANLWKSKLKGFGKVIILDEGYILENAVFRCN